jgi:hypothetical protein
MASKAETAECVLRFCHCCEVGFMPFLRRNPNPTAYELLCVCEGKNSGHSYSWLFPVACDGGLHVSATIAINLFS